MTRSITTIVLEDGRSLGTVLYADPAREGLWFVEPGEAAQPGDLPAVGPFGSEGDGRAWLFARVERDVGMIREVRRSAS